MVNALIYRARIDPGTRVHTTHRRGLHSEYNKRAGTHWRPADKHLHAHTYTHNQTITNTQSHIILHGPTAQRPQPLFLTRRVRSRTVGQSRGRGRPNTNINTHARVRRWTSQQHTNPGKKTNLSGRWTTRYWSSVISLANHASRRTPCAPPSETPTPPNSSAGSHNRPLSLAHGRKEKHQRVWWKKKKQEKKCLGGG